ncbi:MAG: hypothetical protein LAO76_18400 [Acidobacteriia bacterium]|nr:hypothetical protein [Terriglobia bacterium]
MAEIDYAFNLTALGGPSRRISSRRAGKDGRKGYNPVIMGYEKMERRVPCPCGKGIQVVEWEEHDTWSRGDEFGTYRLECEECAARYAYYWHTGHGQVWILNEDSLKLSSMESEAKAEREKLHKLIVERYEEQFVSHVQGLRNRTEMKYALGAGTGFFKNAKNNPSYVEGVARKSIRDRPRESFARLRVEDTEVNGLMTKIDTLNKEIFEFKRQMKKIPVPDRRGNIPKMSS